MPKRSNPIFEYFTYDKESDVSKCLVVGCSHPEMKGHHSPNLINHLRSRHKNLVQQFEEKKRLFSRSVPNTHKNRLKKVYVNISRENFLMGCVESVLIDGRPLNFMQGIGMQRIIRPVLEEFKRIGEPITVRPEYIKAKGIQAQGWSRSVLNLQI